LRRTRSPGLTEIVTGPLRGGQDLVCMLSEKFLEEVKIR
jgi:hypothetical protein